MNVLGSVIGWLTPPLCVGCGYEGQALCEGCATSEILTHGSRCWRCGAITEKGHTCPSCAYLKGPTNVWITTNYEGLSKELLLRYKFNHQRKAAEPISELMVETFLSFSSDEELVKKNYIVVPLPTATSRIRERGFDHSALLAEEITHLTGHKMRHALGRLGQTRQVGAKRDKRLSQLENQFYVKDKSFIVGRNILLIDDVITTGGTLIAATKVLKQAGVKRVDALVFAKKL